MPSVLGQTVSTMEKQRVTGESCTFICTVCGDGFSQYNHVLSHMSVHGPLDSFTFDGSSNGFEVPREYVLQDNGTLTVLSELPPSEYSKRPSSPGILPTHLSYPVNSISPPMKHQSSPRDVLALKSLDSNLDNSNGETYCCEVCGRTFNNLHCLHLHQKYRNAEGGYRCTLCCKFFKGRSELKKHFQNHTFESFRCCEICGKRFVKANALKNHITQNHPSDKSFGVSENNKDFKRTYTCRKCKLTFFWLTDFQTHSIYLCKGKKVSAAVGTQVTPRAAKGSFRTCNGTSAHAPNADVPNSIHASNDTDSTYRCGLCGKQFPELTALKDHHLTHQPKKENRNKAALKSKQFKSLIPKENHCIKKNYLNVRKLMNPCKLCKCVFRHAGSLSRHISFHKGKTCELCGQSFQQQSEVIKHLMLHKNKHIVSQAPSTGNGNIPPVQQRRDFGNYQCFECGKKFGLLCVFRMHSRYHVKEATAHKMSFQDPSPRHDKTEETGALEEDAPEKESGLETSHTETIPMDESDVLSVPNGNVNSSEPVSMSTESAQTFERLDSSVQPQVSLEMDNVGIGSSDQDIA